MSKEVIIEYKVQIGMFGHSFEGIAHYNFSDSERSIFK